MYYDDEAVTATDKNTSIYINEKKPDVEKMDPDSRYYYFRSKRAIKKKEQRGKRFVNPKCLKFEDPDDFESLEALFKEPSTPEQQVAFDEACRKQEKKEALEKAALEKASQDEALKMEIKYLKERVENARSDRDRIVNAMNDGTATRDEGLLQYVHFRLKDFKQKYAAAISGSKQ